MVDISSILRGLRLSNGFTQEQVSNFAGVSKSMISAYETGIRQPSYEVLLKLSDTYKSSLDFMLGNTNVKHDYSLDGLTQEQIETVLKIIHEMKKANGVI